MMKVTIGVVGGPTITFEIPPDTSKQDVSDQILEACELFRTTQEVVRRDYLKHETREQKKQREIGEEMQRVEAAGAEMRLRQLKTMLAEADGR